MKLILTRDAQGIVQHVELEGAEPNEAGRIELPNVLATQITDKAGRFPVVGIEFGTFAGFELVQAGAIEAGNVATADESES